MKDAIGRHFGVEGASAVKDAIGKHYGVEGASAGMGRDREGFDLSFRTRRSVLTFLARPLEDKSNPSRLRPIRKN